MDFMDSRFPELLSSPTRDRCEEMRNPNYGTVYASLFILVGLLVSYLPQHWRIYSRRTTEGISPLFILLGVVGATTGFVNMLTTGPSRQDMQCCQQVEAGQCALGLLGIMQLGVQWACFVIILILFIAFYQETPLTAATHNAIRRIVPHGEEATPRPRSWNSAVVVGFVCLIHACIVAIVSLVLLKSRPEYLDNWANALGVMAGSLAAIQYLPQIATSWYLKSLGSLSIPMMLMQTPGGVVFAVSLYSRLGIEGWSTWGIYVLSASMQGTLLLMGIYFKMTQSRSESNESGQSKAHRSRARRDGQGRHANDDTTPLLNDGSIGYGANAGSESRPKIDSTAKKDKGKGKAKAVVSKSKRRARVEEPEIVSDSEGSPDDSQGQSSSSQSKRNGKKSGSNKGKKNSKSGKTQKAAASKQRHGGMSTEA